MSLAHVHSPIDEDDYLRRKEAAAVKHELVGGEVCDVACDGTRLTLTLDDLYEDTGLLVV